MLVITRREGESITVISPDGTEIEITLTRDGNNARIGVQAPQDYKIVRTELIEEKPNETVLCRW